MMVPADIFDDLRMRIVNFNHRINLVRELVLVIDVPDANSVVITAG